MARFLFYRLIISISVAITVSVIAFSLLRMSGDLAAELAGEDATEEEIAVIAHQYGLAHGPPPAGGLLLAPPCRGRVAAGFPRCCCSLAPRRSKETQKTGDHGGRVRQPEGHCLLRTDVGIPHLLEDGYRALRAPASTSMPSASPEAPGPRAVAHCG